MQNTISTPWGIADHSEHIADGITFYGTPSHGGFKLSADRQAKVPEYMRSPDGWYEEDCEWSIVALVFEEKWRLWAVRQQEGGTPDADIASAKSTLRNWHPDAYEKFFGETLTVENSYKLRERQEGRRQFSTWIRAGRAA